MAQNWPFGADINPNRISAEFVELNQYENEFAMLSSQNYQKTMGVAVRNLGDVDNPRPTGAMVAEFQDLKNDGGTELRIPVLIPISAMPAGYGDTDVTNSGVTANIVYRKAEVNQISQVYDVVQGMQAQILGGKALLARVNNAAAELRQWWTKYTDRDLYFTVFNGVSMSLTTMSGITGGRSTLTPHSHANLYAATKTPGGVSYVNGRPTSSAYETDVTNALNAIGTNDIMTTRLIEDLEYEADLKRIPYFSTRAGDYRVLIVHPAQLKQLKRDADFQKAVIAGGQGLGFDGPAFRNFQAKWNQTLVFSSAKAFGVQGNQGAITTWGSGTYNNMPKYGPNNIFTKVDAIDTNDLKGAILCGPDMITKAYGLNPISFEGEYRVGAQRKTLILRAIMAYVLSDIWDQDATAGLTAGALYENNSSMVCFTYSPTYA